MRDCMAEPLGDERRSAQSEALIGAVPGASRDRVAYTRPRGGVAGAMQMRRPLVGGH
eukprot:CAMPEP_0203950118 /NCGR_PEP_ID=MMETSP0359-20131031/84345_1 /ASSEMBLY_ACC=CAM_ASM_000338 /TAXON_ID=268821 /ORGANISM="Scrippsiella Hangoei, Strain SHTV-5" /LENGTH=56 /DNA_ID=CAMNT_0050882243 /DNA_START=36 /DNA_END=203 /DNA_ORIENTATION=+